jgi:hypothetical protein
MPWEREWTWWTHAGGGNALAFKPPSMAALRGGVGWQIKNLRGLKVLFVKNVFLWLFVVMALISCAVLGFTGATKTRRHNRDAAYSVR